jgi:hypothetical protein
MGSLVAEPLVRRYGAESVPALQVAGVEGNLWSGITLGGVRLVSGDSVLLRADRVMIRPSWQDLTHGVLWLSDLEIGGVRANVEDLSTLAARYGGGGDPKTEGLRPLRVLLKDITFDTPLYSVSLNEGLLTQDGTVQLSADMGGLPVRIDGRLSFSPLEALSADVRIGSGRGSLEGRLMAPFDVRGQFRSLKLSELLSVLSSVYKIDGEGDFDGSFTLQGAGEALKAWGRVGLTRGKIAGIPVSASIPWGYKEGNLVISQAKLESLSADIELRASADLRPVPLTDRLLVRGSAKNVLLKNLDEALSLNMKLSGAGGMVDFWASADQTGNTAGKVFVRLPDLKANGIQIVKGLRVEALMSPARSLTVNGVGEVFGAKLTASGEGGLRPAMLFSVDGMDAARIAATFPALAPLTPAGTLSLSVRVDERLAARGELRSAKLVLGGVRIDDLAASARYEADRVVLEDLKGKIGKAPLGLSGVVDLKEETLQFDGLLRGLSPASVAALEGQVTGPCDVSLTVEGTMRSPRVTVAVAGENNRIGDIPIRGLRLSGTYADDRVSIPETVLALPGGTVSFHGAVDLPKGAEPVLDLSAGAVALDLDKIVPDSTELSLTGRVGGTLKLRGPISDMALEALVESDKITVASMDVRDLRLDFSGTTRNVEVRAVRFKLDDGSLEGKGNLTFGRRGGLNVDMKVQGLELRALLARFGVDAGMGGYLDGTLSLKGTHRRPELTLRVTAPLTVKETLVDHLSITVTSPKRGRLELDAAGRMGELQVNLGGYLQRGKEGWSYSVESGPLDIDLLAAARMPSMKGKYSGDLRVNVSGNLGRRRNRNSGPRPVDISVSMPSFSTAGITVQDIFLPIRLLGDQVALRDGTARLFDGKVSLSADVSLPNQHWRAAVKVAGLDIGKATESFMSGGAIVGSADIGVSANGNYGTLMMTFAKGDFRSGSGYLHKFGALKAVTKDGRLPFAEIRGTFFWDGRDLWLNPGTQVTAPPGAPLYRHFAINGSLGVPGNGLGLMCQGRFDIQALNTILEALHGLFQLMTGTLSGGGSIGSSLLRGVLAKAVGYTEHDFQDVTFQLKGNWQELQLLNLQISKSLESYLTIINDETEEKEKETERRFRLHIRIPTGPGGVEDSEDAMNQFKKQLLDNLLNQF